MEALRGSVVDVVVYVGMAWRVPTYSNTLTQEFVDRVNNSGFRVLNVDDSNLSIFSGGSLRVRVQVLTDGYASEQDAASVVSGAASAAGYNATSFMGSLVSPGGVSSGAGGANTMQPGGASGQSYGDPNREDPNPFSDLLSMFSGDNAVVFGVLAFGIAAIVLLSVDSVMRFTVGQLQDIARQGGWPEDLIVTIAAIGMGESAGDPNARNPNLARENSIGLWQVNRYAWPQYPESALRDPVYNAQAAFAIYQKQGFRAWGAYTNGSYRKHLAASQAAYQGNGPSAGSDDGDSSLSDQLLEPFTSLGSGDPNSILTIAVAALAGLLIIDWLRGEMFSDEVTKAYAALISKFSPEARTKKRLIQERIRSLAIESFDLVIAEFQRLRDEGNDVAVASSTVALIRQQLETEPFAGPMNVAVMEHLMDRTHSFESIRMCSSQVRTHRTAIQKQMRSLIVEDFDISLGEFRRLSIELPGREGMVYAEASALLSQMRQQMETQDVGDPNMGGTVGVVLAAVRGAARDEVHRRAMGS